MKNLTNINVLGVVIIKRKQYIKMRTKNVFIKGLNHILSKESAMQQYITSIFSTAKFSELIQKTIKLASWLKVSGYTSRGETTLSFLVLPPISLGVNS